MKIKQIPQVISVGMAGLNKEIEIKEKEEIENFKVQYRPFNKKTAAEIVLFLASGKSLNDIEQMEGMPSTLEIQVWGRKVPQFSKAVREAKKMRALKLKEDLVDVANKMMTAYKSKGEFTKGEFGSWVKLVERITSIDDKEQDLSLRNKTEVNIVNQNIKGSEGSIRIENPFDKVKSKDVDEYKVSDAEEQEMIENSKKTRRDGEPL